MDKSITSKELLEYGFIETDEPVIPFAKKIMEADGDEISLIVTNERNVGEFAINTPDSILFLKCSLPQLRTIELSITGYTPKY